MITFKRILFPVDFSARSAAVVPSVQTMAKRFHSEVTVLHVVDLPLAVGIAPPEAAAWATLIGADQIRLQGRTALDQFVARQFPGLVVAAVSEEGDPATVIVDYARERQIDLIMMPTSGSGPFRRLLIGSVTAKVLHDIGGAVWSGVHAEEIAAHPPDRWKRILCAVEGDPRDLPALRWAADFASEQKLELRLVHVVRASDAGDENAGMHEFLLTSRATGSPDCRRMRERILRCVCKLEIWGALCIRPLLASARIWSSSGGALCKGRSAGCAAGPTRSSAKLPAR